MTIVPLSREYPCRIGGPVLSRVDKRIFALRYFQHCMACNFCHDICCEFGVDVDEANAARLLSVDGRLPELVGYPKSEWFTDTVTIDPEFPSGRHVRTKVIDGLCVFRNRKGRGCLIHSWSLEEGRDYHDLKPLVSVLFPVTFEYGALVPSNEVADGTLICSGEGPTAYQGARDELIYYFGEELVQELDSLADG